MCSWSVPLELLSENWPSDCLFVLFFSLEDEMMIFMRDMLRGTDPS